MRYFRRPVGNNEWKGFTLGKDEAKLVQAATVSKCIDTFAVIDEVAKKKGVTLPVERQLAVFAKAAPEYTDIAVDYIMEQLRAEKAAVVPASQTATAATAS
jgi:hypothetical protein